MAFGSQRKMGKCGKRRTEEGSDGLWVEEEESRLLRVKIQRKLTHLGASCNIVTIFPFLRHSKKLNALHSVRKFIQARE